LTPKRGAFDLKERVPESKASEAEGEEIEEEDDGAQALGLSEQAEKEAATGR